MVKPRATYVRSSGIAFPHAALAIIRTRRPFARKRVSRETVYAVTDLTYDNTTAAELADAIRGHWTIEVRHEVAL